MRLRKQQCKACPWKKNVDPDTEIPGGYCRTKHENLKNTIAEPGMLRFGPVRMMACHESEAGREYPCVGWLDNQLGPGNNIALRMLAMNNPQMYDLKLDGEQCATFEETLRRRKKARKKK